MQHNAKSIRPFIGAKNFEISRQFYRDLGFEESVVSNDMSFFKTDGLGFYLQDAYVKDWIRTPQSMREKCGLPCLVPVAVRLNARMDSS